MTTETQLGVQAPEQLDWDIVRRELDEGLDRLPEQALRTCQRHSELVTPHLIEVLQEAVKLGRGGKVREGNAHFFALFLLTEFEAKEALPTILQLFSLRDPILDDLIGGAVTETTRRVLAVLAGDQPDLIESLIPNQQLDDFIRWEAAAALCGLVRDGRITRDEAITRLLRQMRAAAELEDGWGVTLIVSELGELNPLEAQDEIKALFARDLVDESMIDWSCFEKYLLHPDQPGVCPAFEHWRPSAIADTVDELRGWHCFSEEYRQAKATPPARRLDPPEQGTTQFHALRSFEPAEPFAGTYRQEAPRVGRNDPCPCGSGKKYKKCCLRAEAE